MSSVIHALNCHTNFCWLRQNSKTINPETTGRDTKLHPSMGRAVGTLQSVQGRGITRPFLPQSITLCLQEKAQTHVFTWNVLSFKNFNYFANFLDTGRPTWCAPNKSRLSWMGFVSYGFAIAGNLLKFPQ